MQLVKSKTTFDAKKVEQMLWKENNFITNLFSIVTIPERHTDFENDDENEKLPISNNLPKSKKPRAESLQELQERLKVVTSKKRLTYKEKLTKKGIKNRMQKRTKRDERNAKLKLERAAKASSVPEKNNKDATQTESSEDSKIIKPIFNSEDKLVFSKFDFHNLGKQKVKKKQEPKRLLQKLTEEKNMLGKLVESGEQSKVIEIREKAAWKNALAKAEGQKVKDDPVLLKKSVKRKEQKVKSSKKKWEARVKGVEKAKEERQKKRTENIQKRKKEKKLTKLKKASKKGKIIPGF